MSQWLSQTRKMNNHYQSGSEGFVYAEPNLIYFSFWYFTDKDGKVWDVPPVIAPNSYRLLLDTDADGNAINRSSGWFPEEANRRHFKIYRPVSTISLAGRSFGRFYSKYDNKNIYYGIICCDQNPIQFGQTLKTSDNYDWRMSYSGAISGWGETLEEPRDIREEYRQKAYSYERVMSDNTIKGNAIVPYVRRFAWYFVYSEDDSEIPEWCKQNCEEIEFRYITKGETYDCFLPDIEKFEEGYGHGGLTGCNIRELQEYGCFREVLYAIPDQSYNYLISGIKDFDKLELDENATATSDLNTYAQELRFENYHPMMGNNVFSPWYNLGFTEPGDEDNDWEGGGSIIQGLNGAFASSYMNGYNYGCLRNPVTKSNEIKIQAGEYGYRENTTIQDLRVTSNATSDDISDVVFEYCDAGCPLYIYTDGDQRFVSPSAIHGTGHIIGNSPGKFANQQVGIGSMITDSRDSIQLPPHVDAYNLPHGRFFLTIDNHIDKVKLVKDFTFVERENNDQS